MRENILSMALLLPLGVFALQQAPATQHEHAAGAPDGTKVTAVDNSNSTVVQPEKKQLKVNADVIRSAQQRLIDKGMLTGQADGRMGPATTAAVRKFQTQEQLPATGKLDEKTLAKLDVDWTGMMAAAPADVGRGAKAAGHDVKGEHPVEASKAMGSGFANAGKKVGHGSKAMTMQGVHKTGHGVAVVGEKTGEGISAIGKKTGEGLSKIGSKISGKSKDKGNANQPDVPR